MHTLIQIADAVVTCLEGGAFSQSFTPVRRYRPVFKLEELATLRVSVVPKEFEDEQETRDSSREELVVDVGVQKKLADHTDVAEIDALMALVQEIIERLKAVPLEGVPAVRTKIANKPAFVPDHLDENHVFTSVVTVTYQMLVVGA